MYRNFFGLKALPFKTTPELQMFYKDGSREQILEALLYTIQRGDGILKVTGEVGSGKTMLLRLVASRLPTDTEIIYINSPNLSAKDILLYICSELKIDVSSFSEKFSLTNALKEKLVALHASGKRVVMLVDEAQAMTFDALEELRLLSNIETNDDKLLQMVLFGQPELDVAMENEKIRQIKSRISYSIYVPPLDDKEVYSYLNYRMRQAGYSGLDVFTPRMSKKIRQLSKGLPRNINVIADKILMACFGTGDHVAKPVHLKDISSSEAGTNKGVLPYIFLGMIILVIPFLIYFGYKFFPVINSTSNSLEKQVDTSNSISDDSSGKGVNTSLTKADAVANGQVSVFDLSQSHQNESFETDNSVADVSSEISPIRQSPTKFNHEKDVVLKIDTANLDEPFLSLYKRNELRKLTTEYVNTKKWLLNEKARYVIQLSTRHLASLDATVKFYQKYKIDLDSLKILLDFNEKAGIFRIKVFFYPSDSFAELSSVINKLPEKIKRDGPYIVRLSTLKRKLKLTEIKLKEVGIINE